MIELKRYPLAMRRVANLLNRFPICLLMALFAIGSLAEKPALAHLSKPRIYIRITKHGSCLVTGKGISCQAIVGKITELHINQSDLIEVMGGPVQSVHKVVDTLNKAGFSNVLAFYEE
jgi:biopolymer transport protein ExbD